MFDFTEQALIIIILKKFMRKWVIPSSFFMFIEKLIEVDIFEFEKTNSLRAAEV